MPEVPPVTVKSPQVVPAWLVSAAEAVVPAKTPDPGAAEFKSIAAVKSTAALLFDKYFMLSFSSQSKKSGNFYALKISTTYIKAAL